MLRQIGTRCNRLFVYLSYVNVYFKYIFAFFWGWWGGFLTKFVWIIWGLPLRLTLNCSMAEWTGQWYLSYSFFFPFFFVFVFDWMISRWTFHLFDSANFISFPCSIKELTIPILFVFSFVILPCICTVFKDAFVYVFAIKKKMLFKKE